MPNKENDIERMERVIPLFIRKIQDDEPITVYGRNKFLDFTYVDDCVQVVYRGLELLVSGQATNHTINLAYGQGNSLVQMTKFIANALGKQPNVTMEPSRVGEVTHYVTNIGKARALLNYTPQTSLSEGIVQAVEWSLDWWANHPQAGHNHMSQAQWRQNITANSNKAADLMPI